MRGRSFSWISRHVRLAAAGRRPRPGLRRTDCRGSICSPASAPLRASREIVA